MSLHFLVAIAAIHRLIVPWLKIHRFDLPALRADYFVSDLFTLMTAFILTAVSAFFTSARLAVEAAFSVELLLTSRKHKFFTAISAFYYFVAVHNSLSFSADADIIISALLLFALPLIY